MRALVFDGPGQRAWREVPDPVLQAPQDVVVRVDAVTICGTDLHILKGDVPTVEPGRILGHEAVGTVVDVGTGVSTLETGDRVLISCITSCGKCSYCRRDATASAWAVEAGFWGTSSTARRPSTFESPSPRRRLIASVV